MGNCLLAVSNGGSRAGGGATPSYDDLYIKTAQTNADAIVSGISHDGTEKQKQYARDIEQDVYKNIDAWELARLGGIEEQVKVYIDHGGIGDLYLQANLNSDGARKASEWIDWYKRK